MPREVFPYPWDQDVLQCFLAGVPQYAHAESDLAVHDNRLSWAGTAIAWYDTAGALVVIPPIQVSPVLNYVVHAAHHMLECLGIEERIISEVREYAPGQQHRLAGETQERVWFYGGTKINPGAPLVLCGPLTVQAYRASKGAPIISPSINK